MPVFEEAVKRLKADRPDLHIVIPAAGTVVDSVRAKVAGWPFRAHVIEDEQLKDDAFVAGTVALACSGTVTTELALAGTPMVVAYRIGAMTYAILKLIFKSPWVTMFNIAAKAFVAPEFLQAECTAENLEKAIAERLDDPALRERQVAAQNAALELMGKGGPDPSEKAADTLLRIVAEKRA